MSSDFNPAISLGTRLRTVIEEKYDTLRSFSEKSGIPYRTVQQYLHGERMPGAEICLRICAELSVNAHWLLTGEGPRNIAPGSLVVQADGTVMVAAPANTGTSADERPGVNSPAATGPTKQSAIDWQVRAAQAEERVQQAEGEIAAAETRAREILSRWTVQAMEWGEADDLARELGLGQLALMARRSVQGAQWRLLLTLQAAGEMTLDALQASMKSQSSEESMNLAADLLFLQHMGLVTAVDVGEQISYRLRDMPSILHSAGYQEASWFGAESLRWLLQELLPKVPSKEGYLSHMVAQVAKESQSELLKRIRDQVVMLMAEAERESASDAADKAPFRVLLGIEMDGH